MESTFIFYDPSGGRWKRFLRLLKVGGLVLLGMAVLFVLAVMSTPMLPVLGLPSIEHLGNYSEVRSIIRGEKAGKNVPFKLQRSSIKYVHSANPMIHPRPAAAVSPEKPLVFGFYVNWDPASKASLRANIQSITHLVPEWLTLENGKGDVADDSDGQVIRICSDAHLPVLAMISNYRDGWQAADLSRVLNTPRARQALIDNLESNVKEHHFAGVMIDFEQLRGRDREMLVAFMQQLKRQFSSQQLIVSQAVPADDESYDLKKLGQIDDYILPMVYDEHYQSGEPGPVASEEWFEAQMDRLAKILPPEKTIAGIGNYGYDWIIGGSAATELSNEQIVSAARKYGAKLEWDTNTQNAVVRYKADNGEQHEIWFLDAVTGLNQIETASREEFRGVGLWRLGGEDPDLWKILGLRQWPDEHINPTPLEALTSQKIPNIYGSGDILHVVETPHDGTRKVWQDQDADYQEQYLSLPSYYTIEDSGPAAGEGKQMVLTFDDGPDPTWTPRLLDVLNQKHVPAVFFVIGLNAESFPALVRREYQQGNLIGNHTYDHPNIATVGPIKFDLELNLTQRLIEHDTGHATTLFRPPYNADSDPITGDEVAPLARAQQLHYTMVMEKIDPQDWQPGTTAKQIVEEVVGGAGDGHVVLLHDGGGDRSATLAAVPQIIDQLRAKGYRFVGLDELMGKPRSEIMPLPTKEEARLAGLEGRALVTKSNFEKGVGLLFLVAIYLTLARSFVFGSLALSQRIRLRLRRFDPTYRPSVSIVIAAFNEDKVIAKTIDSLLRSSYDKFEIVVVDDGSSDATWSVLQHLYAGNPRVRIFKQRNAGKSEALNHAIAESRHHILVALDADTIFDRLAIEMLVRHFCDPRVGAVSGNAKVGNRDKWIARFQSIEYVCGFNLDRRALDRLNAITVVPGAVGAWRKDLIIAVGGFRSDTLAEDTDVTLAIRRLGYQIRYEEEAIAYTEAPETTKALAKQRFRWTFGTLQAAWKHRDALFVPEYGALAFVALPSIWIFQVGLALLGPLAEIAMLIALLAGNWVIVLAYYLSFFVLELVTAAFAYALEGEPAQDLILLFPQRLYFRALTNYVLAKSFLFALRGRIVGWGKLERTASVKQIA